MADINPQTTFHVKFTEKEYNLVMLALALVGGADVKPDGRARQAAAELNQQLLKLERVAWDQRLEAHAKKVEKAPRVPEETTDATR